MFIKGAIPAPKFLIHQPTLIYKTTPEVNNMVTPPTTVVSINFVSLGMVVLDELRFPNGQTLYDVPGGSGLYSTLGARMASSEPKSVGCFVLAGSDFPSSLETTLQEWQVSLLVKKDVGRLSTRGLVQYRGNNFKGIMAALNTDDVFCTVF